MDEPAVSGTAVLIPVNPSGAPANHPGSQSVRVYGCGVGP